MPRKIIVVALLSIGFAACSGDDADELDETAESAVENLEEVARTAASAAEEAVDEAASDAAELVVRNLAAEQGEQEFEDAGFPLDGQGLACEATVAMGSIRWRSRARARPRTADRHR